MKAKTFILIVILTTLFIILIPAAIVLIVDPIQLYHDQFTLKKVYYFKEQRHQNIGLINKYLKRGEGNYTIILGTSMSENFVPSKFMKILDNKHVLKLTMSGGRPYEQYKLLTKALKTGKVKRVVWDIHWYYLLKKISKKDKNHDFPERLYSDDILKQAYYYLFNEDYVKDSFRIFRGKVNQNKWTSNLDKLNYTMDSWVKSGVFQRNKEEKYLTKLNKDIDKIKTNIPSLDIIDKKYAVNLNYPDIDQYVLPIMQDYKNVEFDLFFPPYSTYFYAKSNIAKSIRFIYARKYLVEKIEALNLKNVKVFGFDNKFDIVNNIYYYKDYGHYRSEINDFIMESILADKYILNSSNIDKYIAKMIANINNYNKVFYKDNSMKNLDLIENLDFSNLTFKTNGDVKVNHHNIEFFAKDVKKFAYFSFKIPKISNILLVSISMNYKKDDISMFSISLKNGKEFAHFFIKPVKDNANIILTVKNISKQSKKFKFDTITEIVVRVYPKNKDIVQNIQVKSIQFYGKKEI